MSSANLRVTSSGMPRDEAKQLDESWPCSNCGYDLRGATAYDPICPECGTRNRARERHLTLASCEHAAREASAAALVSGVGVIFLVIAAYVWPVAWLGAAVLVPAGIGICVAGVLIAGRHMRYRSGWLPRAIAGTAFGALCAALVLLVFAITAVVAVDLLEWTRTRTHAVDEVLQPAMSAVLVLVVCVEAFVPFFFASKWLTPHFLRFLLRGNT